MGLMNARNLNKAKSLLEKNRHKVAGVVGKATDQVDKLSKGKSSKVTSKIDDAARKFSSPGADVDEPVEDEVDQESSAEESTAETASDDTQA